MGEEQHVVVQFAEPGDNAGESRRVAGVAGPTHHHRVGIDSREAVDAGDGGHGVVDVAAFEDSTEGRTSVIFVKNGNGRQRLEATQKLLIACLRPFLQGEIRQHAAALRQPLTKAAQIQTLAAATAEEDDIRLPVPFVRGHAPQPLQADAHDGRPHALPHIPGVEDELLAFEMKEQATQHDDPTQQAERVELEHDDETDGSAHEPDRARNAQTGTKIRTESRFDRAAEIEEAIRRDEEHGNQSGDDIQLANQDAGFGDHEADGQGVAWLAIFTRAATQETRRDSISGDSLQGAGGAEDAAQRRRQRGAPQAGDHHWREQRHLHQDVGVTDQAAGIHPVGEEPGEAGIDQQAHNDGAHRTPRDGPFGVGQIT